MTATLRSWVKRVQAAHTAVDVLGADDEHRKAHLREAVKVLHPDRYPEQAVKDQATAAMARLNELLAAEKRKASPEWSVTTRTTTYRLSGLAHTGTLANLYTCSVPGLEFRSDYKGFTVHLKLPRSPRDNDLMAAEATHLKKLAGHRRSGFVPELLESFRHRDPASGKDRRANVLLVPEVGWLSLAEIATRFPYGLDPRDLAWMWRRLFIALSLPHEEGIVHGGVVAEHVLIHPELHGLVLCGWGGSVDVGAKVPVLASSSAGYAPEILAKEPVTPATDIYMLHTMMGSLLPHTAPKQLRAFINGCTFDRPKARPSNSLSLLDEFDGLIERMWGPKTFREFVVPEPLVSTA